MDGKPLAVAIVIAAVIVAMTIWLVDRGNDEQRIEERCAAIMGDVSPVAMDEKIRLGCFERLDDE